MAWPVANAERSDASRRGADDEERMVSNVALLAVAALIVVSPLVWVILHSNGG